MKRLIPLLLIGSSYAGIPFTIENSEGTIVYSNNANSLTITDNTIKIVEANSPPSTACKNTAELDCKGELDLTTNGERYYVSIYNKTHVWTIPADKRKAFNNIVFDYLTNAMTVSISNDYEKDSIQEYCTTTLKSGNMYLNIDKVVFQCHINSTDTYFLRITSPENGAYSIFW